MISRSEAYRTALAKTAGREFTFKGEPVLTEGEEAFLAGLEREDFIDAFQRAIAARQAELRLAAIFAGAPPRN